MNQPCNLVVACVPHSGSSVITHCIALMGQHHHGDPKSDRHGWRRGEFMQFNSLSIALLDEATRAESQAELSTFIGELKPPWVLKDPRLCLTLQWAIESFRAALPELPTLVVLGRDIDEVKHSFELRSQWLDRERGILGFFGESVDTMYQQLDRNAERWVAAGGKVEHLSFNAVCDTSRDDDRARFRALFHFAEPIDDRGVTDAMQCFDHERPMRGHRRKGHSGW